jgi:flagellar protein FlbT
MGLKLKLKPNESVFLSGALIRNAGSSAVLELLNEVPMLREKDILLGENANSPCEKLYLIMQTLYFEEASREKLLLDFDALRKDIAKAAPSLKKALGSVGVKVENGQFYPALKELQKVIEIESQLIAHAKQPE